MDRAISEARRTPEDYLKYCSLWVPAEDDRAVSILIARRESNANHMECYVKLRDLVDHLKEKEGRQ